MKTTSTEDPIFVDGKQCTWALTIGIDSTEEKAHTEFTVSDADSRDGWSIQQFISAITLGFGNTLSMQYKDYISTVISNGEVPSEEGLARAMGAAIASTFYQMVGILARNMKMLNTGGDTNSGVVFKQEHVDVMFKRALSRIVEYATRYEERIEEEKDVLPK